MFATWLAARNNTYGLGDTAAKVTAHVLALRRYADAHPWQYTDIPAPINGQVVAGFASAPNLLWDQAGQVLKTLTTTAHGGPALQVVKDALHVGSPMPPPPPPGAPQLINGTALNAYLCNEDTSSRDFAPLRDEYRKILRNDPVTGDDTALRPSCAGWALPVQRIELRKSSGSLKMSAHRYETVTPYPWAEQMHDAIGGSILTVEDFVHGDVPFVPECATHVAEYFETGKADSGTCPGMQPGAGPGPAPAATTTGWNPAGSAPLIQNNL